MSIIQVHKNLYRGPRPDSFGDLKRFGITRVISLQSGAEDELTESKYEHEHPEDFGMKQVRIRCSNILPPDFKQTMDALRLMSDGSHINYVHCHSGVDRTGFMVAVYRMMFNHWSFDDAHSEWVKMGRHWWFWWWKFELRTWAD